jgi:hypothetical protein
MYGQRNLARHRLTPLPSDEVELVEQLRAAVHDRQKLEWAHRRDPTALRRSALTSARSKEDQAVEALILALEAE